MKRLGLLAVALAGSAAAFGLIGTTSEPAPGTITTLLGGLLPPPTTTDEAPDAATAASRVTLPDLIYYGTCWWQLQEAPRTDPAILLGNGYRNPHVEYDAAGDYFAGTVEKVGANGRVTDVILAFAAAKTAEGLNALSDVTDNGGLTYGLSSPQADEAAAIYTRLMSDPRYADARIHVTGLSLGAAFTQYVLGYSIATYGKTVTAARASFVQFGMPGYSQGVATRFGLTVDDFDGLITGYVPKNDATPNNTPPGGIQHGQRDLNARLMGTIHWMADYQPHGPLSIFGLFNSLAAHESFAYIGAYGLPGWISAAQKQQTITDVFANAPPTSKIDPNYGLSGSVSQSIIGDGANGRHIGMASDDTLQGKGGSDILTGGGGRDSFIYAAATDSLPAAPDRITDFGGSDVIDLSGLRRPGGFSFVGTASPTGAGTVGYRISGNDTLVEVNVNGGALPDMVIRLTGRPALTAANFALGGSLSDAAAYLVFLASNTTGHPFLDHVLLGPALEDLLAGL
ncbi:M10 family metallopeptidase C-terminal domain-containing protein [Sphingomonas sp. MG17]|uniref:M10 family metallopeptidase C-terminal domain-containing protein n=1 Tax=Sphingomonas tagetis TaxID=2949092 RepID=A0A9X2HP94_9SPHN|nr:M10 family metallopeptidase C-terminal domain-containing protein [Sphingomonas tagetis]MCP3731013.1 M10 family metallopeptidase C-terminal domain-containing protein [Sphingomonas tagetis]